MTNIDRLAEIKARLAAAEDAKLRLRGVCKADSYAYLCAQDTLCAAMEERLSHAPADIAWLLGEAERLRNADETCQKLAADCDSLSYENSKLRKEVERLSTVTDEMVEAAVTTRHPCWRSYSKTVIDMLRREERFVLGAALASTTR
jgi:DNA repair ATPase RecN